MKRQHIIFIIVFFILIISSFTFCYADTNINDVCLTFKSAETFSLGISNNTKSWNGTLEYSLNKTNWYTWDGTTSLSGQQNSTDNNYYLYLRGSGNSKITNGAYTKEVSDEWFTTTSHFVMSGTNIECNGNIETLLDYSTVANGEHPEMANYCFTGLFKDCAALSKAPELSALTLSIGCYGDMFRNCTGLINAPALPAETLTTHVYASMFEGCSNLKTAPNLPSTIAAYGGYRKMFKNCTSLENAPVMAATKVIRLACYQMFYGCSSLKTTCELPATSVQVYAYQEMFCNCTSLTKILSFSATDVSWYTCEAMFKGCSNLVEAMEVLPAESLDNYSYREMFYGCSKLKVAPKILAKRVGYWSCVKMFSGCSSLEAAPELIATSVGEYSFYGMFDSCTSLKTATSLPAKSMSMCSYYRMFFGCSSLVQAPELPATSLAKSCYMEMFDGCSSLKYGPSVLPATTLQETCYYLMFYGCGNLIAPPKIYAKTYATDSLKGMFLNCNSLKVYTAECDGYRTPWSLPEDAVNYDANGHAEGMFLFTTGNLTSEPAIGVTYYVKSQYKVFVNSYKNADIEIAVTDFYVPGKKVTFKVVPRLGNEVDEVFYEDFSTNVKHVLTASADGTYSFAMPENDVILGALIRVVTAPVCEVGGKTYILSQFEEAIHTAVGNTLVLTLLDDVEDFDLELEDGEILFLYHNGHTWEEETAPNNEIGENTDQVCGSWSVGHIRDPLNIHHCSTGETNLADKPWLDLDKDGYVNESDVSFLRDVFIETAGVEI